MIAILGELKKGSTEIGPIYKNCVEMWSEVLDDAQDLSVSDLAERLGNFQMRIEIACSMNRFLGKTIMAVSGFDYLYDKHAGFEDNYQLAEKLLQAFGQSMVSLEVKSMAKSAAALFHLDVS